MDFQPVRLQVNGPTTKEQPYTLKGQCTSARGQSPPFRARCLSSCCGGGGVGVGVKGEEAEGDRGGGREGGGQSCML